VLLQVLRGKGAEQIGTAHNSNDPTVAHDRNSFDSMFLQKAGDFGGLGCFGKLTASSIKGCSNGDESEDKGPQVKRSRAREV
jgi:hypothetical protein